MLYASELYRADGATWAGVEERPDELPDLVAKVLVDAVRQRHRRRLTHSYVPRQAAVRRVRGRIDVLDTEQRQLLSRAMVACRYEELSVDTPRHRLVRHALETVAALVRATRLAHDCRVLAAQLRHAGVIGPPPTRAVLSTDRIARHDADTREMVDAAMLALDLTLPTEQSGAWRLPEAAREEGWVRKLFERAVGGFYEVNLRPAGWAVHRGRRQAWQTHEPTPGLTDMLPDMQTDIVLDHAASTRRIVIDTKFNAIVTDGWHREESLRSGYLYQMYAYVMSQTGRHDPLADQAMGVLLHPAVGVEIDEGVSIQLHRFRFVTVDLAGCAPSIRRQLLRITDSGNP